MGNCYVNHRPIRLKLDTVTLRYGSRVAVEDLSLILYPGELFGLLGPNGSGKSSTLAAIAGLLDPAIGTITLDGFSPRKHPQAYASRIGFVPQETALYEELSIRENLRFFGGLYDLGGKKLNHRVAWVLDRVGLTERANSRFGILSGGMQRRVNLAVALLHDPSLLLLDEPTVALDEPNREQLFTTLRELREEGRTILLTTHLLEEAEQWCDRIGVLRKGKLQSVGAPSEVLLRPWEDAIVFGTFREELPEQTERLLRCSLGSDVDFEVIGRRFKLIAPDGELLGIALATLHSEGAAVESFRTPPPRLDRHDSVGNCPSFQPIHEGAPCSFP